MANDRMYMRCKACGADYFLAKHLMCGWYRTTEPAETLEAWMDKHAPVWVHEDHYPVDQFRDGHAVFEVVYESDPDFKHTSPPPPPIVR